MGKKRSRGGSSKKADVRADEKRFETIKEGNDKAYDYRYVIDNIL